MNPYSGDIERFPQELLDQIPQRQVPAGWLSLTDEEANEFETLLKTLRIERYIKTHREDKCVSCGGFVGNHSTKKFLKCAASELARIDLAKHEKELTLA